MKPEIAKRGSRNRFPVLVTAPIDVEPMDAGHKDLFDIRPRRNCMGMPSFEYVFSRALDDSFIDTLGSLGSAIFPFGRKGLFVKIDVPQMLLIEGVRGEGRLRITLRIGAKVDAVRAVFERLLVQAIMN